MTGSRFSGIAVRKSEIAASGPFVPAFESPQRRGVRQLRERSNEAKYFRQRITRLGERFVLVKMSKPNALPKMQEGKADNHLAGFSERY